MSRHRKQIRGDNRLSNTLNKHIGGQLGKKRSRVFVVTFGIVALLALWWLFTSQLGIKAGSGATVFLVVALLAVTWQHRVLHSSKRMWKAFELGMLASSSNQSCQFVPALKGLLRTPFFSASLRKGRC